MKRLTIALVAAAALAAANGAWAAHPRPTDVPPGDVRTLDSPVHQTGDAVVQGEIADIQTSLFALGAVLAPAFVLFWLGFGLATIVAGLLLAGLASRRSA